MIPILFDKTETAFTSLGIGALSDCVSVAVKRVLNGLDELTLTYPDNGVRVQELQNSRIILAQPEYKKDPQPYVIYQVSKPVRGLITVNARHIRERASYIPVMPFTASSLAETLNKIPNYCAETNPFTFWTDKSVTANFNLKTPASLGNVFGGMEGSILDTYGGEYEFDKFMVKIWNRRGVDRGVALRYGKNVTDATQEESIDSTITGICPFWTDSEGALVTLPEKVVHSQNAANFPFNRTIPKDFSEQFENAPTEAQLRAAAQSYISQAGIGIPKVSLSVSFEHLAQYPEYQDVAVLETVNLGDTVTVIFERLDVNATARVVQTEYDVLNEKYRKVSIGGVKSNLNTTINGVVQEAKTEARDTRTSLQRSIDRATDMLTGANGGYLVDIFDANGQRTGDMIMDTNDPATATNVWLRNLAGWGYSSTGVNGQYRTAITQDGHIVADFIDTGTLTANVVKAGILQSTQNANNWWDLSTGEIKIGNNAHIAGWEITSTMIKNDVTINGVTYSPRIQAPATPETTDYAFYVRVTENGSNAYPFYVTYAGKLKATNAEITGNITANSLTLGSGVTIPYNKVANAPDLTVYVAKDGTIGNTPAEGATGFKVSSAGLLQASNAVIYGTLYSSAGKIGGWTIGASGLSKGTTFDNHNYEVGMWSPTTPRSTTPAFYVGYPTGVGSAWEYVYKVDYSGKLIAKNAEITGTITGSTITSTAEKTYDHSSYSSSDTDAMRQIILSGGYPTVAQINKYDINQDGNVDVFDVAIVGSMINNAKDYNIKTTTTISPTNTNAPIRIQFGSALNGSTISMKDGSVIGAKYIRTMNYLVLDNAGNNVVGTFGYDGLKIYDSSRRVRVMLDSTGLYFYNTSGTVTHSYPA